MSVEMMSQGGERVNVELIGVEEVRDREGAGHGFEHL